MRTAVLVVLLFAAALAIAFFIFSKPSYPLSEEDAKKYFLEDLAGKYPSADIREVVEIVKMAGDESYYQLKARVTIGLNTPCPERIAVHYYYPPRNFVAQPPEYITRGCKICINEPKCTIAFPEEAIIASHTYDGTEQVSDFIREHSDAKPSVSFLESWNGYKYVWLVKWSSESAKSGFQVAISRDENKVIGVEPLSFEA